MLLLASRLHRIYPPLLRTAGACGKKKLELAYKAARLALLNTQRGC